jgi:hypothetical protein
MRAANHGLTEVVKFLLKNGANPSHRPGWVTALDLAKANTFGSRSHDARDIISLLQESQRNYAQTEVEIEARNARPRKDVLIEWCQREISATSNNDRRAQFEDLLKLIQSPDIKTEKALNAPTGDMATPRVRFGTLSREQRQRRKSWEQLWRQKRTSRPVIKTSTQAEAEETLPRQERRLSATEIISQAESLALLPVAAPSADTYKHWR